MAKKPKRLKKVLSFWDVFCIASGAMISSGLFILPGLAYAKAGPAVIFSYLIGGILVIPALLSKIELATAMPLSGGTYVYIERSLGAGFGTFGGLANWFSISLKSSFALLGLGIFAAMLNPSTPPIETKLMACAFCILFIGLNIVSVHTTGLLQRVLVGGLFAALIYYAVRGFFAVDVHRFVPFAPHGAKSVFATAGLIFISFGGLTKIASVAEEIQNPSRNIPLGILASFATVLVLYLLVVFVTVGLVPGETLALSRVPISDGASTVFSLAGQTVVGLAAIIAFVTTANAGILSASRAPLAMSRDDLLPAFFQKTNARYGTPHISILVTGLFMIVVILFLNLENLVKTASTLFLLLYIFVNLAVVIMRESRIQNYRPTFKTPLYPWLQIGAVLAYGFLIFEMGMIPLAITTAFILFCCLWYLLYASSRAERTSAIMHIVERITAREIAGATLADELREMLFHRDNIVEDRFDALIRDALILDMDKAMSQDEAFAVIAGALSGRLDMPAEKLTGLFSEREKCSSTVIKPGLAIPHIIVPGEKKFDILLVRNINGIHFSCSKEPVRTMFVLIGSMDERNYHLRALMAIAQIAEETQFERRWLSARNEEELRDVILLSNRTREKK